MRGIDDRELYEVIYSPTCIYCKHWKLGKPIGDRSCPAFPKRIPDAIWEGRNDHTRPYPGDQGIRFELAEGAVKKVSG